MGSVQQTFGLQEIIQGFEALEALPVDEMLGAYADVIVEAQKQTASTMLQGPYYRGGVAGSIRKGKPRGKGSERSIDITFEGQQHGTPLAEIAFINEYGKQGQPARPFIQTAIERSGDQATEAARAVYERHVRGTGL